MQVPMLQWNQEQMSCWCLTTLCLLHLQVSCRLSVILRIYWFMDQVGCLFQWFALLGLRITQTAPLLPFRLYHYQGGYKVKDFVYIGTPMQGNLQNFEYFLFCKSSISPCTSSLDHSVILWIVTVSILSNTTTPWWVSWIWSFGVFALVSLVFVFPSLVKSHWKKAKDVARDKRGV